MGIKQLKIQPFSEKSFWWVSTKKSLKTCHLLKKLHDESPPPTMILKFANFRAKDTVYSLGKNLSKYRLQLNVSRTHPRTTPESWCWDQKGSWQHESYHHNSQLSSQSVGESRSESLQTNQWPEATRSGKEPSCYPTAAHPRDNDFERECSKRVIHQVTPTRGKQPY